MKIYEITWKELDKAAWLGGCNEGLYVTAYKYFANEEKAFAFMKTVMGARYRVIEVEE